MCIAIDEMIMDGEMRGEAIGLARGIANINELVQRLMELGRLDDFLKSTKDMEYQRQLLEEFDIA